MSYTPVKFKDLRDWLDRIDALGQLKRIDGADWRDEIGAVTLMCMKLGGPVLLFDKIKDYPAGYRVASMTDADRPKIAFSLGFPQDIGQEEFTEGVTKQYVESPRIPPKTVSTGPCKENIQLGEDVDVLKFPTPRWNEEDGLGSVYPGRYIGTGGIQWMRDLDDPNWVNGGIYRMMIHDKNKIGCMISPAHHGAMILHKYREAKKDAEMASSFGHDPQMAHIYGYSMYGEYGEDEYYILGGIRGEAVEVVKGEVTDLPVPATAEIITEGIIPHDKTLIEGPFGESSGHYGSPGQEPYQEVTCVTHRDDPIILGEPHVTRQFTRSRPEGGQGGRGTVPERELMRKMEAAGVPGIVAVNRHGRILMVSIRQLYHGHARVAALAAYVVSHYGTRVVIVVDDDINIFDWEDIWFAIGQRADPQRSVDIIHRGSSSRRLEYAVWPPEARGHTSVLIIDATKPFEYIDVFPHRLSINAQLKERVVTKWKKLFPEWEKFPEVDDFTKPFMY
jgi:UbiD family decarboxylase